MRMHSIASFFVLLSSLTPAQQTVWKVDSTSEGEQFGAALLRDIDTGPSGLAGLTITLQGYGYGFDGKVKDSQAQVLTFE